MSEPLKSRLLFPLTERRFTYRSYDAWLSRLDPGRTVRLRDFKGAETPVIALRHDVDARLDSALEFARIEHRREIRTSYFILHTARYYRHDRGFVAALRRLQDDFGHEVGWHSDLVATLLNGTDPREFLDRELAWLRSNGVDIVGAAAHGSAEARRAGVHNNYVFAGWDNPEPGFPNLDVAVKLDPADFGLTYEAYHLGEDLYRSDSSFDERGRRWHPDDLSLETLQRAETAIVLIHPCHWDASALSKLRRLAAKVPRRLERQLAQARPSATA